MNKDKKFDVRLIDRHLEAGDFTKEELDQHLANLKDATSKAERIHLTQPIVETLDAMED